MKIIKKFNFVDVKGGRTWWEKKENYIKWREKSKKQLKLMKKCDKKLKKQQQKKPIVGQNKKKGVGKDK